MEIENIIEIKNLNFSYSNGIKIFDDLSLTINKGSVHGILGDNGAGKTTLFKLLFGLITTQENDGITINTSSSDIAFLEADSFFYSYMTGFEYLTLISKNDTNKISAWNTLFELPLEKYVHNYSTGMKKKICILAVLLLDKKIIILDEPFNGLDLKTCELINYIIQRLKNIGKTILLSSHILETVINNADHISYLERGRITKTYNKNEFNILQTFIHNNFRTSKSSIVDKLL